MKVDYSVEFPPGPMGLELEPLIKSAERELGCRVKDFFYTVGHSGIDQQVLESKVSIGDVISYVNGEDVRSYPFEQIVELLKSMKDQKKTIWFKNITASCQWKTLFFSLLHLSSHRKSEERRSKSKSRKRENQQSSSSARLNTLDALLSPKKSTGSIPHSHSSPQLLLSVSNEENLTAANHPNSLPIKSPHSAGTGSGRRRLRNHSLDRRKSGSSPLPTGDVPLQTADLLSTRNQVFTFSPKSVHKKRFYSPLPLSRQQELRLDDSMPFSPSSLRKLKSQSQTASLAPSPTTIRDPSPLNMNIVRQSLEVGEQDIQAPIPRSLRDFGSTVGSSIAQTAHYVGSTALETAIQVTNALGNQAERLVAQTSQQMPVYSKIEMQNIVQNKYDLLQELSRSVVLLGELEEKQKVFSNKIQFYEEKVEKMSALEAELSSLKAEKEHVDSQLQHAKSSIFILEKECEANNKLINNLYDEVAVLKENNQHFLSQQEQHQSLFQNVSEKYSELLDLYTKETEENSIAMIALQKEYDNLLRSHKKMDEERSVQQDTISRLIQEKEDLENAILSSDQKVQEKDRDCNTTIEEMQSKYYHMLCEKDDEILAFQKESIELRNERLSLKHEIDRLAEEVAEYKTNEQIWQRERSHLQEANSQLQENMKSLQKISEENKNNLNKQNQLLISKDQAYQDCETERERLSTSISIYKLQLEALEQEVNLMKQELTSANSELLLHKSETLMEKQKGSKYKYNFQSMNLAVQDLFIHLNSLKQDVRNQLESYREAMDREFSLLLSIQKSSGLQVKELSEALQSCVEEKSAREHSLIKLQDETGEKLKLFSHLQEQLVMLQEEKRNSALLNAKELQSIHTNMNQLSEENRKLSSELEDYQGKYHDVLSILEEKENDLQTLRAQSNQQIIKLTATIDDLNQSLVSIKQDLTNKENQFLSSLSYMEQNNKTVNEELTRRLAALQQENVMSKELLVKKDKEVELLLAETRQKSQLISALEQDTEDTKLRARSDHDLLIEQYRKTIHDREEELSISKQHFEEKFKSLDREYQRVEASNTKTMQDYSSLQHQYQQLLETHENAFAEATREAVQYANAKQHWQIEHESLLEQVSKLQHELSTIQESYSLLEEEIASRSIVDQDSQYKYQSLAEELEKLRGEYNEQLAKQIEYDNLIQTHNDLQEEFDKEIVRSNEIRKECEILCEKYSRTHALYEEAQDVLQEMEETYEKRISDLRATLEECQASNDLLKKQVQSYQQQRSKWLDTVRSIWTSTTLLQGQHRDVQCELVELLNLHKHIIRTLVTREVVPVHSEELSLSLVNARNSEELCMALYKQCREQQQQLQQHQLLSNQQVAIIRGEYEEKLQNLQRILESIKEDEQQHRIASLDSLEQLQKFESLCSKTTRELSDLHDANNQLKKEVTEAINQKATLQGDYAKLQYDHEMLQMEVKHLQHRYNTTTSELEKERDQYSVLSQELATLQD
eukprot:scaffold8227_cov172-Ochromonas_danica.AAC.1